MGSSHSYLLHDLLFSSASTAPDKQAISADGTALTYAETANLCEAIAATLQQLGVTPGDRVGVLLDPGIEQAVSIFAASAAGGVFVPINTGLFADQVGHIVSDCRMAALVTTARRLSGLIDAGVDLSTVRGVICVDDFDGSAPMPVADWGEASRAEAPRPAARIGRDLAGLMYTSGSTGAPKGVMVSHEQVIAGSAIVSDYLSIQSTDRILGALPFSFDAGLNQLITAWDRGATIVPMSFAFGREVVKVIEEERITALAGVPTLWHLLIHPRSRLGDSDTSSLRYITNTGGHMPEPTLVKLRELLPQTEIFLMYGLTEAFRSTYLPPAELDRRPDSMGRAIPNTEILVLRPDGTRCDPGEVGELVHRGPTVSLGYWERPELTRERLRPLPGTEGTEQEAELVCFSGDLVRMDDEGFLYFVARNDAMIKTSGFRVSPTEVESIASDHPAVSAAAAVGVADPALGQAVVLFVVASDAEIERDLIGHIGQHRPPHMVPKKVIVVDAFPQTTSGKVDYPALKAQAEGAAG